MAKMVDKHRLLKALREVNAGPVQVKMATILLAINGIENALDFIKKLEQKNPLDRKVEP